MLGNMSGFSFLWQCLYFPEYLDCCQHLAGAILSELSPSSAVTKEVANCLSNTVFLSFGGEEKVVV